MKITLQADEESKSESLDFILTNDNLENLNFIEILVEDKSYSMLVSDLFEAVKTFQRIKDKEE